MKERMGVDSNENGKMERIEGGEIKIKINYVRRKKSIFNKKYS